MNLSKEHTARSMRHREFVQAAADHARAGNVAQVVELLDALVEWTFNDGFVGLVAVRSFRKAELLDIVSRHAPSSSFLEQFVEALLLYATPDGRHFEATRKGHLRWQEPTKAVDVVFPLSAPMRLAVRHVVDVRSRWSRGRGDWIAAVVCA